MIRTQGFSKTATGFVPGSIRLSTQPGQPVFVAGTRVGIQVIPETVRDLVVVPTNAGTRQCVVARPPDRQGATRIATNSASPQTVST